MGECGRSPTATVPTALGGRARPLDAPSAPEKSDGAGAPGRRALPFLPGLLAAEGADLGHGLEKDFHVENEGIIFDIAEVVAQFPDGVIEARAAAVVDLGPAGDVGFYQVAQMVAGVFVSCSATMRDHWARGPTMRMSPRRTLDIRGNSSNRTRRRSAKKRLRLVNDGCRRMFCAGRKRRQCFRIFYGVKYAPLSSSFDKTAWCGRPGKMENPKWFFHFPTGVHPDRPDNIRPYRPLGRTFHARLSGLNIECGGVPRKG
jgi:hypothetical protein